MKSKNDEFTQRILLLLKIDANNLFKRIKERKSEYLEIFALRRTREHFPVIFKTRYEDLTIEQLSHCSTELITTLNEFYNPVEEMRWYLYQTEDMPNTVDDFIERKIRRMEKLLSTLNIYLDAELGIVSDETPEQESIFPIEPIDDNFSES
jgi:hypothetical protein